MAEHNPYRWYEDLQVEAELSRKEREENFSKDMKEIRERVEAKRQADQELFNKALQKNA